MISNKKLDALLKKHRLTLVLSSDDDSLTRRQGWYDNLGPYSPLEINGSFWFNIHWKERTVVAGAAALHEGMLVHELMHAAYPQSPSDTWRESHTGMYAAERLLAKEMGMLEAWNDYFLDTPIDDVDTGGQVLWKWLSPRDRRRNMEAWEELVLEEGLVVDGKLLLVEAPGQTLQPQIPRGLHFKTAGPVQG